MNFNCSSIFCWIWSSALMDCVRLAPRSMILVMLLLMSLLSLIFHSLSTLSKELSCSLRFMSPELMMFSRYLYFFWKFLVTSMALRHISNSALSLKGFLSFLMNSFAYFDDTTLLILL